MDFEIVGGIQHIETMAVGSHIRDLTYLQKVYGHGRWRKLKGIAFVKLPKKHFVLCVDNTGYEASLIVRKMYEVIPDQQASRMTSSV